MTSDLLTREWSQGDYDTYFKWWEKRLEEHPDEWTLTVEAPNRRLKAGDIITVTSVNLETWINVKSINRNAPPETAGISVLVYEVLKKEIADKLNYVLDRSRNRFVEAIEAAQQKNMDPSNTTILSSFFYHIIYFKQYHKDGSAQSISLGDFLESPFLDLLVQQLPQAFKELPTRYPREYLRIFPQLMSFKKALTPKSRGGNIEFWGTLPPLAHQIVLSYFYFLDPTDPLGSVTKTPSEWLEALGNVKILFPSLHRQSVGGSLYQQFDRVTSLMLNVKHPPIWQGGWVTEYTDYGKPRPKKRAWKFEGSLITSKKQEYFLEDKQVLDRMTEEEKERLTVKSVTLQLAEPFLSGLTKRGIGHTLGYHKDIMDLFHRLGKNWLAKQVYTFMLSHSSMQVKISKGKLIRWCFSGREKYLKTYYPRCLQRLKDAIKKLEKEGVFLEIEQRIPYKHRNKLGEKYFDRYHKSLEFFIPPSSSRKKRIEKST